MSHSNILRFFEKSLCVQFDVPSRPYESSTGRELHLPKTDCHRRNREQAQCIGKEYCWNSISLWHLGGRSSSSLLELAILTRLQRDNELYISISIVWRTMLS